MLLWEACLRCTGPSLFASCNAANVLMHLAHTLTKTLLIKAGVRIPQTDTGVRKNLLTGCAVINLAQGTGDEFKVTAGEVEACDFLFA